MARLTHFRAFSILIAAACGISGVQAQGAAPFSTPGTAPEQRPERPPAPKRTRAISPAVAAQLAASTPKFDPAPPTPPPKPQEELPDMREIDKPRNTIIRLPQYVVQEEKPVVLSERAVHTQQGLADLAVRRYISDADRALNRFTLPLFGRSVEERALMMYAEEERLRNMAELADNAAMVSTTDKAAGAYVKREADKTYLRSSDFGWRGNSP